MSPNDSWSGTNQSASFGVLQCLWQLPQVTHPSHKRLPPNVLSSAAMPWPNRLCSFGFHGRWCSNLLRFRGELREAGTCWSCDICDSGPWFSGVLACGSTCSIWVLFTTAWLALIKFLCMNPPATPIRVDARKQPQNSNRILTVVGCGRFSDSEL
jgi:hypothetical protein